MQSPQKHLCYVAVDPVLFTIREGKLCVLLYVREKEPFKGLRELPGALLLENETAEEALHRKLLQIVGKDDFFFTQFATFTQPMRDPRTRAVSIGFVALVPATNNLTNWFEIDKLPKLAFDHEQIIFAAKAYLKDMISPKLVKHLLPQTFPLNALQQAYEIIEQKSYDNRNFRKWILLSGFVIDTKTYEKGVSHRPGKLYCFKKE